MHRLVALEPAPLSSVPVSAAVPKTYRERRAARESGSQVTPIGPIETAREIYAEAGLAGFTNGATTRALYWAPAIGMCAGDERFCPAPREIRPRH